MIHKRRLSSSTENVRRDRKAASASGIPTETGRFAADMKVALVNDGPVTFWLEVEPWADRSATT